MDLGQAQGPPCGPVERPGGATGHAVPAGLEPQQKPGGDASANKTALASTGDDDDLLNVIQFGHEESPKPSNIHLIKELQAYFGP